MKEAASAAALGDTTDLSVGLSVEQRDLLGSRPTLLHAEEVWAYAWKHASPDFAWPSPEERAGLRACLEELRQHGGYNTLDVFAAALKAGSAHQAVLAVPDPHDSAEGTTSPVRLPPEFAPGGGLSRMPADDSQGDPRP